MTYLKPKRAIGQPVRPFTSIVMLIRVGVGRGKETDLLYDIKRSSPLTLHQKHKSAVEIYLKEIA